MKEKIVLVLPSLPVYRLEFLIKFNKLLTKKDKELIVISGKNKQKKEIKEIQEKLPFKILKQEIIGFKMFKFSINWQKGLLKIVWKEKPHQLIMLANFGNINYLILLILLKIDRTPYILWGSGYNRIDLKDKEIRIKNKIESFFIKHASGYVTYSQYFANKLIKRGIPNKKVIVAQNTINIEKIIEKYPEIEKQRDYKFAKFLFVGAIIPQKKLDLAILACKILLEKGYRYRFDIVGGGAILYELKEKILQYSLTDTVFLHGPKYNNELEYYFISSNVFILPGTGGLAINEAMAYSLPVISTPGDGTAYDLIKNGENGFLLDYNYSIDELVSRMEYFITNIKSDKLITMGQNSLRLITKKATLENMAKAFVAGMEKF